MAVSAVIIIGRTRLPAPSKIASRSGRPCPRSALKYEIDSRPSMMATPKIEMKPTAAEMLKFVPVSISAQMPPIDSAATLVNTTIVSSRE